MRNALELLLLASLSGSVLGLLVLFLRKLSWKRAKPSFWYYLWILVAVRLLLPLEAPITTIQIPAVSPYTATALEPAEASGDLPDIQTPEVPVNAMQTPGEAVQPTPSVPPASQQTTLPFSISQLTVVLCLLWLVVAGGKLISSIAGTIRFTMTVRSATKHVEPSPRLQRLVSEAAVQAGLSDPPQIYTLSGIAVPLQIGLWTPVVLLPEHIQDNDDSVLRHILLHECIHHKRRDILFKWLTQLFVCIHWFNPLVYLFRQQIAKDCELSCDAEVLYLLNADEYKAYGDMLLTAANFRCKQMPTGSVMLSEDARTLKSRLVQIADYGRRTRPLATVSVAMVVVLLICGFVAGPSHQKETPPQIPYRSPAHQLLGVNDPKDIAKDFEVYKPYGLTHSLEYNRLYFNGELVRYFEDIESATSYKQWAMPDGTVDAYALRDKDGTLVRVEKYSQAEFDARTGSIDDYVHAYTYSITISPQNDELEVYEQENENYYTYTFDNTELLTKVYDEYEPFGLTYHPGEDRLYYNGKLVKFFSDLSDDGVGTSNNRYFGPYPDGEVTVTAQRDTKGVLIGLTVKEASDGDGAGIDWRNWQPQWTNGSMAIRNTSTEVAVNSGTMTRSMPISGVENIEIIAPVCELSVEKSSGTSIEAIFSYPNEMEPNYTKYVQLVMGKSDANTALVEIKYDDHGFDPVPGMDEEDMGYPARLTVKIPDQHYNSLTLGLVASARDTVWDIPLAVRANTLNIRSVANNVRIIANVDYEKIHILNKASELYFVTRAVGEKMDVNNSFGTFQLKLLEEPQNIAFDLSEVDVEEIPGSWQKSIQYDTGGTPFYRKGAGTNIVKVINDTGSVMVSVS